MRLVSCFVYIMYCVVSAVENDEGADNLLRSDTLIADSASSSIFSPKACAPGMQACGDGFCCCEDSIACCINQNLTYIPLLPDYITVLNFTNNSLYRLENNTLQNLTSLHALNLESNDISFVDPTAFASLKNLKELRLGQNKLNNFDYLVTAIASCASLTFLNVSHNRFKNVTLGRLSELPNLKTLLLYANNIRRLEKGVGRNNTSIEHLDLGSNWLEKFPEVCVNASSGESFLPRLTSLRLDWNMITSMNPFIAYCLPRLISLDLSGNTIRHIRRNFLQSLPSLEKLTMKFCMSREIEDHAFNHTNLKALDISENLWFFDHHYGKGIQPGFLRLMPELQSINMSWTVFRFSTPREIRTVLSAVKHVQNFVLHGSGLDVIPPIILEEFTNLTSLSFSHNDINLLADNTFENLTSLRHLDLLQNHITYVSQSWLQAILERENSSVMLGQNPFACTCDLLWFIEEYRKDSKLPVGERKFVGGPLVCKGPGPEQAGKDLDEVDISRAKCAQNQAVYLGVLFILSFLIILLLLVAVIYKYRWQLRFLLYTLQHRLSRPRGYVPCPPPKFDVFVSYDSSDANWVKKTLRPELEDRRGFRLCLHERDFTPGRFITHNIIERMAESAAVLPVISRTFVASQWCRFELQMALRNSVSSAGRRAQRAPLTLLPVLMEDMEQRHVDSLLCALLSSTTYLAWPSRPEQHGERERFWRTLATALDQGREGRLTGRSVI